MGRSSPPGSEAAGMHVVATAGHVDHGKSTLVQALTGTDPDRWVEEKQRGLTIDLGFAWMHLPPVGDVAFVDVPGHVRFISNMLAGVAVVEAGILCVDAREGWRAQTEEHLRILDLVGLPLGLVVLTKAGLVEPDQLALAREEVVDRVAGSALEGAPVVAVDSVDGTGLDELRTRLAELLAGRPRPVDQGRPRLWVDRSFTIAGAGTVVTGGVVGGRFAVGDEVEAVGPRGPVASRLRAIEALGRRAEEAPPATRAALNLAGMDRDAVRRGDVVVRPGQWQPTHRVDATLDVLAPVPHDVTRRGAYLVYVGSGEHAVTLRPLDGARIAPGTRGAVRLTFRHGLPLAPGDRYVLRETGRGELVGGGEVTDIAPTGPGLAADVTGSSSMAGVASAAADIPPEHDWVRADELRRRLGIEVEPVVDGWVVSAPTLHAARRELLERLERSRPLGLDVNGLDERERAVLTLLTEDGLAETVAGYAVGRVWRDELADDPYVTLLEAYSFTPPAPDQAEVPPEVLRALLRRDLVMAKDGVYFATSVRNEAQRILAKLSEERPDGFTASEARQALDTTRKWVIPLLELLDEARVTVRVGDRRHVRSTATTTPTTTSSPAGPPAG